MAEDNSAFTKKFAPLNPSLRITYSFRWILLIIVALSVFVRTYGLTKKSFWFDEAYVYWVSVGRFSDLLWRHQAYHDDPPMIGIAVNLLNRIVSDPQTIRIVPLIFGIMSVVAFSVFALRQTGPLGAIFATALMTFSYNQIAYSQEITEYSLCLFLTICAISFTPWPDEEFTNRKLIFLTLIWFVSPICAYGMFFPLAAIGLTWLCFWLSYEKRSAESLKRWFYVQLFAVPSSILVYQYFLSFQIGGAEKAYLESWYWSGGGVESIFYFLAMGLKSVLDFSYSGKYILYIVVVFGFLVATKSRKLRRFSILFIVMLSILFAFSTFSIYPFYGGRQTIFLTPFCYLFAGCAVSCAFANERRSGKVIATLFALVLVAAGVRSTIMYHRFDGNEDIKAVGRILLQNRADGDAIFVYPKAAPAFFVHFRNLPGDIYRPNRNPMDTIFEPHAKERWKRDFLDFLSKHDRVWVVFSHIDQSGIDGFLSVVPRMYHSSEIANVRGAELFEVTSGLTPTLGTRAHERR